MGIAIAYCWASGEISIAAECEDLELPEGVITFARGELHELIRRIETRARHSYDPGLFLVPGLPECDDREDRGLQSKRVAILTEWVDWAFSDWPENFEKIREQPYRCEGGGDEL
jgi:hypothetical protein